MKKSTFSTVNSLFFRHHIHTRMPVNFLPNIPLGQIFHLHVILTIHQVSVTPFLKEQFNKSISYGGAVLTLVSVGMCIGSLSVGILLQKRIVSHFTAMAIGALCVCFGLLVTFPPEFLPTMYHLSPITAFPAVFIAGVGDPLMTIATLKALYDIQVRQFLLLVE